MLTKTAFVKGYNSVRFLSLLSHHWDHIITNSRSKQPFLLLEKICVLFVSDLKISLHLAFPDFNFNIWMSDCLTAQKCEYGLMGEDQNTIQLSNNPDAVESLLLQLWMSVFKHTQTRKPSQQHHTLPLIVCEHFFTFLAMRYIFMSLVLFFACADFSAKWTKEKKPPD